MKNNSFRYLHLFLVVCSVGLIFSTFTSKKEERTVRREPTSLPRPVVRRYAPRTLPKLPREQRARDRYVTRGPASTRPYDRLAFESVVKPRADIRMASGNVLATNLGAIPLTSWRPGMPPLIYDDGIYGFYEKTPGDKNAIPVAYNKTRNELYPISTIVHVSEVNEAIRQKLLASGLQEYLYFKNIQRLSLKSSPDGVVHLYDTLARQGLNVKLEVIRERPKAH